MLRRLPAYFPSHVVMAAAFTTAPVWRAVGGSLLYGAALLAIALAVFALRTRPSGATARG